jgi:hypothetical protein
MPFARISLLGHSMEASSQDFSKRVCNDVLQKIILRVPKYVVDDGPRQDFCMLGSSLSMYHSGQPRRGLNINCKGVPSVPYVLPT